VSLNWGASLLNVIFTKNCAVLCYSWISWLLSWNQ